MADLTTLANVTGYLRFTPDDAESALLSRMITAISALAETYCGRGILSAAYTEVRDGNGRDVLFLNQGPVTAVASVTVGTLSIPPAVFGVSPGYRFTDKVVLLDGFRFALGCANVTVNYTAGYAETPPDIEQAVIEAVALRYREIDRIGAASQAVGGETNAYITAALPKSAQLVLDAYKRVAPVLR